MYDVHRFWTAYEKFQAVLAEIQALDGPGAVRARAAPCVAAGLTPRRGTCRTPARP